jgi:alpha-L-arabinofuranosidase
MRITWAWRATRAFPDRIRPVRRTCRPLVEGLERRRLLATISVNAGQVVRTVDTQVLGVNVNWWDSDLNTSQTEQMVEEAGLTMFRFPGGSSSDDFHFNAPPTYNGEGTDASMASFIASVGGVGLATVDYGSGSSQEAAAFLAYLDGSVGNTTPIGDGQEWNDSTSSWQTIDWQTAGYWAGLRAAAPLTTDDGLNFLRLDHPEPFNIHYWEVGNEEYGSWEIDHHAAQHDPATYIGFATQFQTYADQIEPGISIGLDVGSPGSDYNNWTADILRQAAIQGLTVGFLSDHNYVQSPGSESDSNLLLDTVGDPDSDPSDPGNPYDWALRAGDYENLLTQYLGPAGKDVELLATEFNSVDTDPGKQTTSLVNGLFVADALGAMLETPYNGADVWDLRNGYSTSGNNSSSLYGWRQGGDYGLIGSPGGSAPATGAYVPYPTYFAEQLASKVVQNGGTVVQASSNNPDMSTYAVLEPSGDLELLVINKNASSAMTGQFQIANFQPATQATVWQYGEAQDTAQSETSDGQSALASSSVTLTLNGSDFGYSFPAYSMTVLDLGAASGNTNSGPVITQAASAAASPVIGTTTELSVSATDPSGDSGLTFTWITTGIAPASVTFSANGTNAAQNSTATFTRAGSYTFQVTASDPAGNSVISSVTVAVDQILTSIAVSPGSVTTTENAQQSFSGTAYDQFGDAMISQPALSWSVIDGGGTIGSGTGLYTAPDSAGTATVRASSGGITGKATVAIASPTVTMLPPGGTTSPPGSNVGASVAFSVVSSRKKKFEADITISNTGSTPITRWVLTFNFAVKITRIWNARVARHSGSRYMIDGTGDDSTIPAGQSVSFEFQGTRHGVPAAPTHYVLNGTAINSKQTHPQPTSVKRIQGKTARSPTAKA